MRTVLLASAVSLLSFANASAQIEIDVDPAVARAALSEALPSLQEIERSWLERMRSPPEQDQSWVELFGYDPPGRALQLAWLSAFLFEREGRDEDALRAARLLARMADYRDQVPEALRRARIEYRDGLPAVPSFFQLADYAETWIRIRGAAGIEPELRATIEQAIAGSADFIRTFPEWGAHNRALLRAECLLYAALALPEHPQAPEWRTLAGILAGDSIDQWEIEDAQIYHPIWLQALFRYAHASGRPELLDSIQVRYYLRYFQELLTPLGNLPAFGDAWWNANLSRYHTCLEWGAARFQDPHLKWAARRIYRALAPFDRDRPELGRVLHWARVADHLDPDLEPAEPPVKSGPVLDDVIGKKIVFRDGHEQDDLYLLLNYRDEGNWGLQHRDFLRHTLAVEHEKMHHGNSDENSIVLFLDRGSVLLHDAGYRDQAPSGPNGEYRADLFHNRLVARQGRPGEGESLKEFLLDEGHYRPVRTEKIDYFQLDGARVSRTRLTDDARGYAWDRTLVLLDRPRLLLVFDTLRIERPGDWTFATLWASQKLLAEGDGFVVGAIDTIGRHDVKGDRALRISFAGIDLPGRFSLRRHTQDEIVVHAVRQGRFDAGAFVGLVSALEPVDRDAIGSTLSVRPVTTSRVGRSIAVSIEHPGGTILVALKADLDLGLLTDNVRPRYRPEAGSFRAGEVETDADFLMVRRSKDRTDWVASNMTRVRIDGQTVFESRPFQVFQVTGRSDVVGRSKWRRWQGTIPKSGR